MNGRIAGRIPAVFIHTERPKNSTITTFLATNMADFTPGSGCIFLTINN